MVYCKCDCGVEKLVNFYNLRKGVSLSCGCMRNEASSLPSGESARRCLYKQYQCSARNRKYEWNITREQFDSIITKTCRYCGILPSKYFKPPNSPTGVYYNGLDRIDNSKGYIFENVCACCSICNQAKHILSEDDFLSWIDRVYIHQHKIEQI